MMLLRLFYEFFKVGLFAIGGGMATFPFLTDLAAKTGWYTQAQLVDMVAIAESTPGPIGVNTATYVGFTVAGIPGALTATIGLITPSVIIILIIARVLARFNDKIITEDYQLIYVLNANRPEVRSPEAAIAYLRGIEATTSLTCTGIVNNTHLCGETTPEEIRKGARLAEAVSRETGIPVLCHVAEERFVPELSDLSEPVFPITIQMKKPWE